MNNLPGAMSRPAKLAALRLITALNFSISSSDRIPEPMGSNLLRISAPPINQEAVPDSETRAANFDTLGLRGGHADGHQSE